MKAKKIICPDYIKIGVISVILTHQNMFLKQGFKIMSKVRE